MKYMTPRPKNETNFYHNIRTGKAMTKAEHVARHKASNDYKLWIGEREYINELETRAFIKRLEAGTLEA